MIYVVIGLLVVLYLSQEFIRKWFFVRTGKRSFPACLVRAPVDGTVCYVKKDVKDFEARKRWDSIRIPRDTGDWFQVGIYMSGFDRHFVVSPLHESRIVRRLIIGNKADNVAMIDFFNFVKHYYFGRTPKLVDTSPNHTLVYEVENTECRMIMAVIADKYVGNLIDSGEDLPGDDSVCLIRRGSQTDLFIPMRYYDKLAVSVGDRVKVGGIVCSM